MQLLHGDCLNLMKDIPDKSIDMILCDLPYGTTACKWDIAIPFEPLWKEYKRIIKDKGCIALFGTEPFSSFLRLSNLSWYKYDWIWEKNRGNGHLHAKTRPLKIHENISVFCNGVPFYNPIKTTVTDDKIDKRKILNDLPFTKDTTVIKSGQIRVRKVDDGTRFPVTIQKFNNCNSVKSLHPTQKPVPLLEYLIKTYTNESETILDNCMGSGSTGVACINTNRNFIGIEKDDKYFEIAKKRIEEASCC